MTKDVNKFTKHRLNDYIIFCDTCGAPCWKSQATLLKTDTGLGGSLVCPRDVDKRDYGLVPYKIPAEKSVPVARVNSFNDNSNITQAYEAISDFSDGGVFNQAPASNINWEDINTNWEDEDLTWDGY